MHMLSLRKVWYWALQHLLSISKTSCLVYNRVVDILAACGEVFLPSTADPKDGKEGVSSMCTRQLLSSTLFFALILLLQQEESQHG